MSFMYCSEGRRGILNPEKAILDTIQNISCALNQNIKMAVLSVCVSVQNGLSMGGMGEITPPGESSNGFLLFMFRFVKRRIDST